MNAAAPRSLLLALLCGLLLLPGVAFRTPLGLEYRTGLFVREILRNGPSFIPRLDGTPYFDYPPLYFLSAAVVVRTTGSLNPLTLALPGILAAMGTVFLVSLAAACENRSLGWMAGAALITMPAFAQSCSQATVDPLLTFFIVLALLAYHRSLQPGARCILPLAWVGLVGGVLTKGPLGAALPLSIIIAYHCVRREWRALGIGVFRLGVALVVCAALCCAAIVLIDGKAMLRELLDAQLLDRMRDEPNNPRLFYLGVFFGGFAPWSLFAFLQIFRGNAAPPGEDNSFLTLCKVWLFVTFLMLSLATVKHGRYFLPAAPPTAILCAAFWEYTVRRRTSGPLHHIVIRLRAACIVTCAAMAIASLIAPLWLSCTSSSLIVTIPAAGVLALAIGGRRPADDSIAAFAMIAVVLAVGFLLFCQFVLPLSAAKDNARPFVERVERAAGDRPVVFFDIDKDHDGLKYRY
jgi:4-amino-4-deoxy-L-arabinose transferase-like glycosyltransferase